MSDCDPSHITYFKKKRGEKKIQQVIHNPVYSIKKKKKIK